MEKQDKQSGETSETTRRSVCTEEKFVWPWVGLVANIQTVVDESGQRVGRSGSTLRDELIQKGFNPTRVIPIWNFRGHSGFSLVEFNKDIKGFENAMNFERSYKSDGHGKKDWEKGVCLRDDKPYGWVCREDDYNRRGIVGEKIKKKRDLKSVSQLHEEEERKMVQLVENMSQSIEMKIMSKQELEDKMDETSRVLESVELHNYQLNEKYKQEVEKSQANLREQYEQIMMGHDKSMSDLETEREKLEERARKIYINEAEMEKSRLEIEMNQKAMLEQNEANMEAMKLAEKHQKEKEKLHEKIMEMEAKLNETQELELEIEKLKGSTNVMKHMADGDVELMEKIAKTQMELDAREAALHDKIMSVTQKERMANDEYQEARKEMIQFWNENEDLVSGGEIRVKRMGHLDTKPFVIAVKKKLRGGSKAKAELKAMELCSFWEGQVGDVHWHPFRVDESDGIAKNVVDKNDEKLVKLKDVYGEELYNEVVRAKMEIVEYNPSGGYVVSELWNFEKNRKGTMEEATDVMLKIRKKVVVMKNKRKRRCV